jgi:hypothetical protein
MRSAADASESWSESERSPSRPSLLTVALVFVAVLWTSAFIVFSLSEDLLAWDVRFAYLPAADAILDGRSPYPALDDPILEDQKGYVYPPQLAVFLLPLTKLPIDLVALIVTAGMLAMLWLTLRILGIRDVRCYAAALLWMPVASGVLLANVSIPLALALAFVWGYRDRVREPAVALGLAVSAKFLLWPMLVWTLATSRLRTTLWAVVVGVVVTFVAWAAIGFDGLGGYVDLLRRLSERRPARRLRRARPPRRRTALIHVRRCGDARVEPHRVAALSRPAARAAGDRPAALLDHLAASDPSLDEPPAGICRGFPDVSPGARYGDPGHGDPRPSAVEERCRRA